MISTFNNILQFLINTIGGLFLMAVLLRLLLQRVRADFYNPLCQAIVKITNPLLVPLRRIIPGLWGWDMASLVLAFLVQLVMLLLLAVLLGFPINGFIVIVTILRLITLTLNIYFFAILLRALSSWLNPNPYNPGIILLIQLTEPVLGYARRYIPNIASLDFSPLVVLIIIQILLMLIRQIA